MGRNFNPRSRKESDYGVFSFNSVPMDFNPRSRKESDLASHRNITTAC